MAGPRASAATVVALVMFVVASLTGCSSQGSQGVAQVRVPSAAAFLHRYVSSSGAVVRYDQGGDVVSEGQGYALLLSYAVDDPALFAKVWAWTRSHLQLPDGLFAYHWQSGKVTGSAPAADADTQIAWALELAGQRWSIPADTAAAKWIATAIANNEIGYDDQGHPTLAAGEWAIRSGQPVQVEPGYWTFPAYSALASLTGDNRWKNLAAADAAHLESLTGDGSALPPDWAALGNGNQPAPTPTPQTGASPVAGQDGLRAMVWASCLPSTHNLATSWWHAVAPTARLGPLTRSLQGPPVTAGPSPLSLVSAAAVADVAGNRGAMRSLLALANRTATAHPTYYGDAWNALGHVLLTTQLIPGCSP